MKVILADNYGFCPGVKNAIKTATQTLSVSSEGIYSLGPIIHNKDAVEELAEQGLKTVDSLEEISEGTVLIRSHGATREQLDRIKEKGLGIIDATCVLVKRLQKISSALAQEGYQVVIIGDKQHPEVMAVVGSTDGVMVAAEASDFNKIPEHSRVGIICQTTQSPDHFAKLVGEAVKQGFSEIKVINTLCKEAVKRQQASVKLCRQVDVMFVLGGLNSANTRKLAELCKRYNKKTYHLENFSQLDSGILAGVATAGVTAGASTPDSVVSEFVENLRRTEG